MRWNAYNPFFPVFGQTGKRESRKLLLLNLSKHPNRNIGHLFQGLLPKYAVCRNPPKSSFTKGGL